LIQAQEPVLPTWILRPAIIPLQYRDTFLKPQADGIDAFFTLTSMVLQSDGGDSLFTGHSISPKLEKGFFNGDSFSQFASAS